MAFNNQLTSLPSEIKDEILLTLPVDTIIQYCQTNKKAYQSCKSFYFWQRKADLDFSIPQTIFKKTTLNGLDRYLLIKNNFENITSVQILNYIKYNISSINMAIIGRLYDNMNIITSEIYNLNNNNCLYSTSQIYFVDPYLIRIVLKEFHGPRINEKCINSLTTRINTNTIQIDLFSIYKTLVYFYHDQDIAQLAVINLLNYFYNYYLEHINEPLTLVTMYLYFNTHGILINTPLSRKQLSLKLITTENHQSFIDNSENQNNLSIIHQSIGNLYQIIKDTLITL